MSWKTASGKVLRDKAFNIAKYPKYDGYQPALALMVYNFFYNWSSGVNTSAMRTRSEILPTPNKFSGVKNKIMSNQKLAEELHTNY